MTDKATFSSSLLMKVNNSEVVFSSKSLYKDSFSVIFLNVKREDVQKRILGRITCEKCNLSLNEFFNQDEIFNHPWKRTFKKKSWR